MMTIGAQLIAYQAGAVALHNTRQMITRYIACSPEQATALALWTCHTHAFKAAEATPYLRVFSATAQSGKTRTLEVLELLAHNPWLTARTTSAALVRKVSTGVTLLLDESDHALGGDKDYAAALMAVLNAGYRLGGCASVCVGAGGQIEVRDFSVFSPKVISGIGTLPDTLSSRCIPIELRRRGPDERVEKFRRRDARSEAQAIRESLETWCQRVIPKLEAARPEIPDVLSDRAADVWEPLIAISDEAGHPWPTMARDAAVSLSAPRESLDIGIRLLSDIRTIFDEDSATFMSSTVLLESLQAIVESPWADWSRGRPISARRVRDYLKTFDVHPIHNKTRTARGYDRGHFEDAFARYLPDTLPADIGDIGA